MSGPSHGSPVADSDWNENDQSATPRAVGDETLVSSSCSWYGSPSARMRAGRECAVNTTCARRAAHPVSEQLDEARLVVPALDERELCTAGDRLLELCR